MRWFSSYSNKFANAKSSNAPSELSTDSNGWINPLNGDADTIA